MSIEFSRLRKCNRILPIFFGVCISLQVNGQSLFDSALHANEGELKYSLNGFVRSSVFSDFKETKDASAELALKLETNKGKYGNAFVEARYKQNLYSAYDQNKKDEFYLREAYCDLRLNKLDIRLGQQIILWGRADGFNPTNNITPSDMTIYSSDEDESRLENFVSRIRYNTKSLTYELIWVPFYRATQVPLKDMYLADGAQWGKDNFPSEKTGKSSFGFKLDMVKASFDASLSFYDGYYKMPGLRSKINKGQTQVFRKAFRTKVIGADFSTVVGNYGLRGEFAFSRPDDKPKNKRYIPNKQIEYTLGIDREWGKLNLIVQYIGKQVIDYPKQTVFNSSLEEQLHLLNSVLFAQTDEYTHSVSVRPSINLRQETIIVELLGLTNFTTKELYLKPMVEYLLSDDISLIGGAQLFYGPDDSLFGMQEKKINSAFAEVRISF